MAIPLAQAFELAFRHEAAGRRAEARAIYEQILAALPGQPGALLKIAEQELAAGSPERAAPLLEQALATAPDGASAATLWRALARTHRLRGDSPAAQRALAEAERAEPGNPVTSLERGTLALETGDPGSAEAHYRAALELRPASGEAAANLALALRAQGRLREARAAADKAVELAPGDVGPAKIAASIALATRDEARAAALADAVAARAPDDVTAFTLLGLAQKALGAAGAARSALARAVALDPRDGALRISMAGACLDAGAPDEARTHLDAAIALGTATAEAFDNLGIARRALGDDAAARDAFARAAELAPRLTPALANLAFAHRHLCDWEGLDALDRRIADLVDDPGADPRLSPFIALVLPLTPAQQLVAARRWSVATLPSPRRRLPARPRGSRLRIGYLSSDFREHPTGRLMVGLFEAHDRDRCEVFAYSYGPDDASPLRARIRSAVDAFRDLQGRSDPEIAQAIRDDGIDVLVDRKGHTRGGRLGILAWRPAPVQLHYMSFPGTTGYAAVDGLIADATVAPPAHDAHFSERVFRLPRPYFATDRERGLPPAAPRAANGLPERALVLACMNQSYKLARDLFGIWMEALAAAPDAVLWLFATHPVTRENLRAEAGRAGVAPERLVFAGALPQDAHMARLQCADLMLDTLPCGAHTTACDALWAGVPVLTCLGPTFAGRVGATLLEGVGLPELIAVDRAAYRAKLLALVRDPARIATLGNHLARGRDRFPLFDTPALARAFEALLEEAYAATLDSAGRGERSISSIL